MYKIDKNDKHPETPKVCFMEQNISNLPKFLGRDRPL